MRHGLVQQTQMGHEASSSSGDNVSFPFPCVSLWVSLVLANQSRDCHVAAHHTLRLSSLLQPCTLHCPHPALRAPIPTCAAARWLVSCRRHFPGAGDPEGLVAVWESPSPLPQENPSVREPEGWSDLTQAEGKLQATPSGSYFSPSSLCLLLSDDSFSSLTPSMRPVDRSVLMWHLEPYMMWAHSLPPHILQDWPPSLASPQLLASPPTMLHII